MAVEKNEEFDVVETLEVRNTTTGKGVKVTVEQFGCSDTFAGNKEVSKAKELVALAEAQFADVLK
jgi:ribosomal protein L3